jgi:hypothetical protein
MLLVLILFHFVVVGIYHVVTAHRTNVHQVVANVSHVVASVGHVVVGVHHIVGPCLRETITLDPTFGSFILLELILYYMNWFL